MLLSVYQSPLSPDNNSLNNAQYPLGESFCEIDKAQTTGICLIQDKTVGNGSLLECRRIGIGIKACEHSCFLCGSE